MHRACFSFSVAYSIVRKVRFAVHKRSRFVLFLLSDHKVRFCLASLDKMAAIGWMFLYIFYFCMVCQAQYTLPNPDIALLSPNGIRFQIPDDPGISLVAYHYSINKPLNGVDGGDYNVDFNSPTDGFWRHNNVDVTVHVGDVVNFWYLAIHEGQTYNRTDQSWTAKLNERLSLCSREATKNRKLTGPASPTSDPTDSSCPSCPKAPISGTCNRYPCDASCDMSQPPCNGLIFEDNFDRLDLNVWEHEITAGGGGNWEFQYYINNRTNSYVRDGILYIKPTLTEDTYGTGFISSGTLSLWGTSPANLCTSHQWWGCERAGTETNYINPIQSARLRTAHSFSFTYGKVELSAKMPVGDWLWPAIWLHPKNNGYGDWPASGEIDIVESRGNLRYTDPGGKSVGVDHMGSVLHWGPFLPFNAFPRTHGTKNLNGDHFGNAFHNYSVEWTPDNISFFVDDEQIMSVDPGTNGFYDFGNFANLAPGTHNPWENSPNKMAPFDQEFYFIMNVAVGGTGGYFTDVLTNQPYPKPWSDASPTAPRDFWLAKDQWYPTWNPDVNNGEDAAMQVDYIRVWADGTYQ